jgi:hypothetical protein
MSRNKVDKQATWHCSSCADSDTCFLNLNIEDKFQTELLWLHWTLGVLHTWWFFETLQNDILAKEGGRAPYNFWIPYMVLAAVPVTSYHRAGRGCLLRLLQSSCRFFKSTKLDKAKMSLWFSKCFVMYVSCFEENMSMALNQDLMSDFAIVLVTLLANWSVRWAAHLLVHWFLAV